MIHYYLVWILTHSVIKVTSLGLEDRNLIPGWDKNLPLRYHVQVGFRTHPDSYWMGTKGICPEVKVAKADHSPLMTAEVKNDWSFTTTLPTRLRGVELRHESFGSPKGHQATENRPSQGQREQNSCPERDSKRRPQRSHRSATKVGTLNLRD
jgi:hypothetical protein